MSLGQKLLVKIYASINILFPTPPPYSLVGCPHSVLELSADNVILEYKKFILTKVTSKYFENPIPNIYLNDSPTKNDPNNKKKISKIIVDNFIEKLVEFEETVISKGNDFL